MSVIRVQQGEQLLVFLLCRMVEGRFDTFPIVEEVFTNKVQAEAALRVLSERYAEEESYFIKEAYTMPHDNNV